jgi:ketosteroid isomerase-like protein
MTRRTLAVFALFAAVAAAACSQQPSAAERAAIAADIEREVKAAYNLKSPDPVANFERLYADSGRVVSASGGMVIASRDTIFTGIKSFWQYVGSNMKNPTWMWGPFLVDVLSKDVAVMTVSYHVPHTTPSGNTHVIGGAWTAVFKRQGDRWVIVQEHLSDTPPEMADSAHAHMNHPPSGY